MKTAYFFVIGCFCLFYVIATSVYSENIGAKDMVLEGGSTGNVPFPHHRHQKALNSDCQSCHKLFPQEKDVIVKLKQENVLKKKAVMNNCQSCHRDLASQGKATGPTKCKACHSGQAL